METPFSNYKSMGNFLDLKTKYMTNVVCGRSKTTTFYLGLQSGPKPFFSNDATHKISRLANWLQRYSSSKVWSLKGKQWSDSAQNRTRLPVLVTSNFDDDSIKNYRASMETQFSHYKSMGNFLNVQGQLTPKSVVRSGYSNSSRFYAYPVICKYKKNRIKSNREKVETPFSPL